MNGKAFVAALGFLLLVFFAIRNRKKNLRVSEKTMQLKSLYKREAVFLCNFIEQPNKNQLQLYGESFNSPLRPGMKITISGTEHVIKEVYANDKTPNKPDPEVLAGVPNTPIVIENGSWDWKSFRQNLKNEIVVPLKLE